VKKAAFGPLFLWLLYPPLHRHGSNPYGRRASNSGLNERRRTTMSDVLYLLLGLVGIGAMFAYARFCNRS